MRAFRDRREAGRLLAERLVAYAGNSEVVVLALPRGGVPVGYEVAMRLGVPLDVLVVRKIGVPGHEELAMGAIASGGIRVVDERTLAMLGISAAQFQAIEGRERAELERRETMFRTGRAAVEIANKTVILVDDGLATGASMAAAIDAVRGRNPARVVVAVPIAAPEICAALGERADEIVCLRTPANLYAVGIWYEDFAQTTDAEVRALLDSAHQPPEPTADPVEPAEQWDH